MCKSTTVSALTWCLLLGLGASAHEETATHHCLGTDHIKLNLKGLTTQAGTFRTSDGISINIDASMNAVGVGLSLDVPLLEYLSVGAYFNSIFASLWAPEATRKDAYEAITWLDIGPVLKGSYTVARFRDGPSVVLTLSMPIGPTFFISGGPTAFGWNISVLPGAEVFLTEHVALFLEGGFAYHSGNIETIRMDWTQGAFNFGASYVF